MVMVTTKMILTMTVSTIMITTTVDDDIQFLPNDISIATWMLY